MKKGKPKRTRQDAERLFDGLNRTKVNSTSRPENPFEVGAFEVIERDDRDESKLWKENIVSLPVAIELPPGYGSADRVREGMGRAWCVQWLSVTTDRITARLPEGWGVDSSISGIAKIYAVGVVRAEWSSGECAPMRLICRYRLEEQYHDKDDHCRIVVRDREFGRNEKESFWDAKSGPLHPQWKTLSDWLDKEYPDHRDPLRYWEDCERNFRN
jgi:hypothetical protein